MVWFNAPLVPLMVRVDVPVGVPGDAVTVIVVVPEPVTVVGLNVAVAPVGSPVTTLKLTTPLNPLAPVMVTK